MIRRLAIGLASLAMLASCTGGTGDGTTPPVVPTLTTLAVSLSSTSVPVGQTTTASASGRDQNGAPIATGAVTWSSNAAAAAVTSDGNVTGVAPGQATITASAGGKSGHAEITITALPATALALRTPPSPTVANRSTFAQQPAVQLVNAKGQNVSQPGVVVVTATVAPFSLAGTFTATTDAAGVATFAGFGVAGTVGARTITFSANGLTSVSATTLITPGAPATIVAQAGNQQTVAAGSAVPLPPAVVVADADANPVQGVQVIFEVMSGNGAVTGSPAITNASGVAVVGSWTLGAPGLNSLQAHPAGGTSAVAFTALATQAPALAVLSVTVAPPDIQVGETAHASATGIDQYGAIIATGPVAWSSNSAAATISTAGVINAVLPGQAVITGTANGKTGVATITITAQPITRVLASIVVSATPSTFDVAQTSQAGASGLDQFGAPIAIGAVTWSAFGAATINQAGVIRAVAAGQATIRASLGSISGETSVTVTSGGGSGAPVLTSLTVTLANATIQVGATAQASVTGRDQFGAPIATGNIVWSASGAASISAQGVVTGASAGNATITANAGGISGQASLTVTSGIPVAPVLTTLVVTLTPAVVKQGEVSQASVQGFDQYGAAIATGPVVFSSSSTATNALTITSAGLITANYSSADGSVIVAKAGNVVGEATLEVRYVASIELTMVPATILIGETSTAVVQGLDRHGVPIDLPITLSIVGGILGGTGSASQTEYGKFVGISAGTVLVRASGPIGQIGAQRTATTTLTVKTAPLPPHLYNISVTVPTTISVGQTVHLDVTGVDQYGNPISVGQIAFYADPVRVATVDQFGNVTGLNPGQVTLSVSAATPTGNIIKQFVVQVPGTPTSSLSVSPPPPPQGVANLALLPVSPTVSVTQDATGELIKEGSTIVTATLTSGGGVLRGTLSRPAGAGATTFNDLSIRGMSGPKTITFSAPGHKPATWTITLFGGAPNAVAINGGNNQTAPAGAAVPVAPSVRVTDVDGNTVSGATVQFVIASGGGSFTTPATVTTDANGIAQVGWTLGNAGSNTLTATVSGVGSGVTFVATATAQLEVAVRADAASPSTRIVQPEMRLRRTALH